MINTNTQYAIHAGAQDLWVALECEADRAEREGFNGVATRQRALALHIRNAVLDLEALDHDGYHLVTQITFAWAPTINPVRRRDQDART